LRAKIERDPKKPETIKTVHGLGYVWAERAENAPAPPGEATGADR
jgi:hypothetical protein